MKKIVLAYSGGLDTSCLLAWLKEKYDCPVVAYVADVGQNEDLAAVRRKAVATGAEKCVVDDLREEFARDYVFMSVMANGVYEGAYLMGTALARPVIAKGMVRTALAEGADAVAHGSTGKGNDQVRFELTTKALAPQLRILAPWRTWEFTGRHDLIAYAKRKGIPVSQTAEKPYSMDANLMHISYEGGILEDPDAEPPAEMFQRTVDPRRAPDQPLDVEIGFERGSPVSVNGKALGPAALLTELNKLAGAHGVGRADVVEDRFVGMKSRGVYETPGGTLLHKAHRAVASLTMDREAMAMRDKLAVDYAALIYRGFWFSPEREALQALIDKTNEPVTGSARLRLFKGSATTVGRKSPNSLYRADIVTFEDDRGAYDQRDAGGFIKLHALRLRTTASVGKRK